MKKQKFQKLDNVLINYGKGINKLATFLESADGNNLFQDIHGKFILTDSFISIGKVTIEIVKEYD